MSIDDRLRPPALHPNKPYYPVGTALWSPDFEPGRQTCWMCRYDGSDPDQTYLVACRAESTPMLPTPVPTLRVAGWAFWPYPEVEFFTTWARTVEPRFAAPPAFTSITEAERWMRSNTLAPPALIKEV